MKQSRQEKAYELFKKTSLDLLRHDGYTGAADAMDEAFTMPGMSNCFEQAFSNVLWKQDELIEKQAALDMVQIIKVIQEIADPSNENTQKIVHYLKTEVAEAEQEIETLSAAELHEIVGDEEDNTPISL